ncbi:nickel pincer cofactor biosynthesis protein LarB [Candidatus Saganbacteria bacterium]|nr:nickel pincer cofactor biosynthesis protein LarB [Candidatus Saganbacteria bacterium]
MSKFHDIIVNVSKNKPHYEDLGFAKIDHHRIKRKGFPEVIYCQGKTPDQIAHIASRIAHYGHDVLATRADKTAFKAIKEILPKAKYHKVARIVTFKQSDIETKKPAFAKASILRSSTATEDGSAGRHRNPVLIVTAGTSDIPVSEEAAITAEFLGLKVEKLHDVGVAGIHRLLKNIKILKRASVIIAVAGMEGALPSVIGGLISAPIIAVPTSVGYGASFKGLSALLTMLNSCAPGVAAVNIDNGFGAAVMANAIVNRK